MAASFISKLSLKTDLVPVVEELRYISSEICKDKIRDDQILCRYGCKDDGNFFFKSVSDLPEFNGGLVPTHAQVYIDD